MHFMTGSTRWTVHSNYRKPSQEVALTTSATLLADLKLHSHCYLFTVLNSGLFSHIICFFWPWQHRGWPSQQLLNPFPSVSVNLWPMTSSSNLT